MSTLRGHHLTVTTFANYLANVSGRWSFQDLGTPIPPECPSPTQLSITESGSQEHTHIISEWWEWKRIWIFRKGAAQDACLPTDQPDYQHNQQRGHDHHLCRSGYLIYLGRRVVRKPEIHLVPSVPGKSYIHMNG